MSDKPDLLGAALAYARLGLAVFPCKPGDKPPLTAHGHHDASKDPEVIGKWWEEWPDANIGVPCAPNGLLVLDVDRHPDPKTGEILDGFATLQALGVDVEIDTPTATTGGGGRHYLFALPEWEPLGTAGPGLDVKAHGYIIVAPSVHPSGTPYRWLKGKLPTQVTAGPVPAWLEAIIRRQERQRPQEAAVGARAPFAPDDPRATAVEALALLSLARCDSYAEWLAVGMALHSVDDSLLDEWDRWSRNSGKYAEGVCADKWRTFHEGDGVGMGSLVQWVRDDGTHDFLQRGWLSKQSGDAAAPARQNGAGGAARLEPAGDAPGFDDGRDSGTEGGDTQAARALALLVDHGVYLFRSDDGEAFASVPVDGHREPVAVSERGGGLRRWLNRAYRERYGRPPSASALTDAAAAALADADLAPVHRLHLRLAEHDGRVYLDLGRVDRRVVEVDAAGWRVTACPDRMFFRRPSAMRELPLPQRGGSLESLRALLAPWARDDETTFILLTAWLVGALQPGQPFAALALYGEQGTGKSTLCRLLRSLVDPCGDDGRGVSRQPRDEESLAAVAVSRHVLAFDNLSSLPMWLSDALSSLATGAGWGGRKRYTDFDTSEVYAKRPVIFNGIVEVATKADLLDRCLVVTLNPIADDERREEADLWAQVDAAAPSVLGGLLTAVSAALRHRGAVKGPWPRMADFARWVTAAEPALPWPAGRFREVYGEARRASVEVALDSSPLPNLLTELVRVGGEWQGTTAALLDRLNELADEEARHRPDWPKDATRLGGELRRLAPAMRAAGRLDLSDGRTKRGRWVRVAQAGDATDLLQRHPSVTTGPTASPQRHPDTLAQPAYRAEHTPWGDAGDAGDAKAPTLKTPCEIGERGDRKSGSGRDVGAGCTVGRNSVTSVTNDPDDPFATEDRLPPVPPHRP